MPDHVELPKSEYVAILDAGSQYGKVIDRKVRELRVESIILPLDTPSEVFQQDHNLKGIIISGGPSSVYEKDAPAYHADLFSIGKPILGICYGMQLLAHMYNGEIIKGSIREDGQDDIMLDVGSPIFAGMEEKQVVLLTHGDSISSVGDDLAVIARSSTGIIAAVGHRTRPLFGVQFHPEVELTVNGLDIFKNFLSLCGCTFNFTMEDREAVALRKIHEHTANGQKVLCLASGGVDSTVCAVLLLKALGPERVVCIHIDHGFMRLHESEQVVSTLQEAGVRVHLVNAVEQFANATTDMPAKGSRPAYRTKRLSETVDPEEKRNIIGNVFMDVCGRVIEEMSLDVHQLLLAQGTLRPDLIESGSAYASKKADAIKTHHNDTSVVRQLRLEGRIIEPLCDYHKDEVRELGVRLGIPRSLVERQPFPGPGLAIRTLCSDGTPFMDGNFDATEQCLHDICAGNGKIAVCASLEQMQLTGCVLPIRTVGVQGDGRTYAYAAALSLGRFPGISEWTLLHQLAKAIPKEVHSVNRVVFMFGDKQSTSPRKMTPTTLVPATLDKLRIADDVVNRALVKHNLIRKLSQVPVVLVPVNFETKGSYGVVIRTFITNDFMTGVPAIPGSEYMPVDVLEEMVAELEGLDFVSRVLYDLTAKPPGTTEWE